MKSKQIALRIENKSLRSKIRKSLIAHGFEDRTNWNNEWESDPRINHIIIRDFDRIEFHSHSGCRTTDKDVITIEPNSFDALFLTL